MYLAIRKLTRSLCGSKSSKNKEIYIQMKFSYSTLEQRTGDELTSKDLIKRVFARGYNELVIALPRRRKVFRVGKKEIQVYYEFNSPFNNRQKRSPSSNELYALITNLIKYRHEKK